VGSGLRKEIFLLFIGALAFFSVTTALKLGYSYNWNGYNPGRWMYYSNPLLVIDVTSYRDQSVAAANSWTNSPCVPSFGMYGMPSAHDIGCVKNNYGTAWNAYTYCYIYYGYITHADVKWNSYYMDNFPPLKRQNTCCHEYGHTLGLADNSDNTTIMCSWNAYDSTSIYTPQNDDIAGINAHYP
jgi:hypothetical protein